MKENTEPQFDEKVVTTPEVPATETPNTETEKVQPSIIVDTEPTPA